MNSDRSVVDILQDILRDLQGIMRAEILLAKTEVRAEGQSVIAAARGIALGGVLLAFAFLFLLIGITAALALVLPLWAAAAILAGGLFFPGAMIVAAGLKRLREINLGPQRSLESIKETLKWTTQPTR